MQKNSHDFSEAARLAASPAGQQLLTLLRQADQGQMDRAAQLAQAGDYAGAGQLLKTLLTSPQARELLKQLGR